MCNGRDSQSYTKVTKNLAKTWYPNWEILAFNQKL